MSTRVKWTNSTVTDVPKLCDFNKLLVSFSTSLLRDVVRVNVVCVWVIKQLL